MPCPAPSPLCSGSDDNSAVCPAPPYLLCAVAATTDQPRALPHPISFVQQWRQQLSHTPYPAPSPSCGNNNNSSATRPTLPCLLRVATTTTAQPHALSRPVSFMWQ